MIVSIPNVLTADELTEIQQTLAQAEFVEGKLTAGWHAKLVKQNQQLKAGSPSAPLYQCVHQAIARHSLFQAAVRPRHVHSVLFSRYGVGMSYGRHVDNALMGAEKWRSDVSFTLFLNAPSDYQGGALVIEEADDERLYKLDAGSMLIYPSTTLHRVDPVTAGVRLVAVGWVQSLVRDAAERELLFDLETVRRSLFAKDGKTDEFDLLSKSIANLLRKWVD